MLTTNLSVSANITQTNQLDLALATFPLLKTYATILQDGSAAGLADRLFTDTRTIAASSNDDLDLAGVLTDAFGAVLTFARIKALIVSAATANTNNVVVGGSASNPVTSFMTGTTPATIIRPGATWALIAGQADATGYAVTAATADILRVSNSGAGTPVTYDIIIVGSST